MASIYPISFRQSAAAPSGLVGEAPIGTIVYSSLELINFQAAYSNRWVDMVGQSITGSALASLTGITTLPNMNNTMLRGAGARAINTFQSSSIQPHAHTTPYSVHAVSKNTPASPLSTSTLYIVVTPNPMTEPFYIQTYSYAGSSTMIFRNLALKCYIRIN